jgi:hypothetical protein
MQQKVCATQVWPISLSEPANSEANVAGNRRLSQHPASTVAAAVISASAHQCVMCVCANTSMQQQECTTLLLCPMFSKQASTSGKYILVYQHLLYISLLSLLLQLLLTPLTIQHGLRRKHQHAAARVRYARVWPNDSKPSRQHGNGWPIDGSVLYLKHNSVLVCAAAAVIDDAAQQK